MVFEKLYKFIGKDIKSMMERPEGHYCLRLHKNRVYYVSEALMKKATNVSTSKEGFSVAAAAAAEVDTASPGPCPASWQQHCVLALNTTHNWQLQLAEACGGSEQGSPFEI